MEFIFELIFEFLVEGAFELIKNNKIKGIYRNIVVMIITALFLTLISALFIIITKTNILMAKIVLTIAIIGVSYWLIKFWHKVHKYKQFKSER